MKKGIMNFNTLIWMILIVGGFILIAPVLGIDLPFQAADPEHCNDNPEQDNCFCNVGEIKREFAEGAGTYLCDGFSDVINPDDTESTLGPLMIDYTKMHLNNACQDCNMIECPSPAEWHFGKFTDPQTGDDLGIVECRQQIDTTSRVWASGSINLADGAFQPSIFSDNIGYMCKTRGSGDTVAATCSG